MLKDRLTLSQVLTLPEGTKGFVVYCDASRVGLGVLLCNMEELQPMLLGNSKFMRRIIHLMTLSYRSWYLP